MGSIKKDIMAMLANGEGDVTLNEIAALSYNTKPVLGAPVDHLVIRFSYVTGLKGGRVELIESRDYDGIINEASKAINAYLIACADAAISNLKNGYR